MGKFLQKIKENKLLLDSINVVAGFVLLVSMLVFFINQALIALLLAIWAAGFMNMANGLKVIRKNKKGAPVGQSMVMLGMIILVGGTALVLSAIGLF